MIGDTKIQNIIDMTNYELIRLNESLLRTIVKYKVHVDDVRYTSLYRDYLQMNEEGHKVTYIVAVLSRRYGIGERKVYTLCHRFSLRCDPVAVDSIPSSHDCGDW